MCEFGVSETLRQQSAADVSCKWYSSQLSSDCTTCRGESKASSNNTALDYWIAVLAIDILSIMLVEFFLIVSDSCLASILSQLRNSCFIEELCR